MADERKLLQICRITSYAECENFISGFQNDPVFSDPMLRKEEQLANNLLKVMEEPAHYRVLGIYRGKQMVGLFSFLVLEEERYLEMLVGLSRDGEAYGEMFRYLERNFPGYSADFVFNPSNYLLKEMLEARGAVFEPEQQKMVLQHFSPAAETDGIELYSEKYEEQYLAIHQKDTYWTGEKVLSAPDRFRVFLAVHEGKVVGYLDVTWCFEENEPYDLFVLESSRRKGFGRKMLAKALEMNDSKGMMLLTDVTEQPMIRLCESLGFEKAENENSLTVHYIVETAESFYNNQ